MNVQERFSANSISRPMLTLSRCSVAERSAVLQHACFGTGNSAIPNGSRPFLQPCLMLQLYGCHGVFPLTSIVAERFVTFHHYYPIEVNSPLRLTVMPLTPATAMRQKNTPKSRRDPRAKRGGGTENSVPPSCGSRGSVCVKERGFVSGFAGVEILDSPHGSIALIRCLV